MDKCHQVENIKLIIDSKLLKKLKDFFNITIFYFIKIKNMVNFFIFYLKNSYFTFKLIFLGKYFFPNFVSENVSKEIVYMFSFIVFINAGYFTFMLILDILKAETYI